MALILLYVLFKALPDDVEGLLSRFGQAILGTTKFGWLDAINKVCFPDEGTP